MFSSLPVIRGLQKYFICLLNLTSPSVLCEQCVPSRRCHYASLCATVEALSHWKLVAFFYRASLLTAANYSVANCLREVAPLLTKGLASDLVSPLPVSSGCCCAALTLRARAHLWRTVRLRLPVGVAVHCASPVASTVRNTGF